MSEADLRKRLRTLYDDADDVRRVLEEAGVRTDGVDFTGSHRTVAHRAAKEAQRQGKVADVLAVIAAEYPPPGADDPLPASDATPAPSEPIGTVAVVAVGEELGAHRAAVVRRLGALPGLSVRAVEAAEPGALPAVDRVVALVGCRTGGGDRLAAAVEAADAVVLGHEFSRKELMEVDAAERTAALALQGRASETFATPDDAAEEALKALRSWWDALARPAPGRAPVLESWERKMLAVRRPTWCHGRHGPLQAASHLDLNRADLYTPLHADTATAWLDEQGRVQVAADLGAPRGRGRRRRPPRRATRPGRIAAPRPPSDPDTPGPFGDAERGDKRTPVPLEQALTDPRFAAALVVGEPGAGKTVLLEHIAYVLAVRHLGGTVPPHRLHAWVERAPLPPVPVLLEASKLASALAEEEGVAGLVSAVAAELHQASGEAVPADAVRAGLAAGRYVLLIDSLDEVPGEDGRARVVRFLEGYADTAGAAPFVLTTRPSAYVGSVPSGGRLRVLRCAPLDGGRVAALIDRWCRAHAWDAGDQEAFRTALSKVETRAGGAHLSTNPLLLTCALLVFDEQKLLPDSTAELYRRMVDILCRTRRGDPTPDRRRQYLEAVAAAMQAAGGTAAPVDDIADALRAAHPDELPDVPAARAALDALGRDTGLLRFEEDTVDGRPRVLVRPWHRSFQEYLAACHLAADERSVTEATDALVAAGRLDDPAWTDALRFLFGVQAHRGRDRIRAYLDRLHHHAAAAGPDHAGRRLGLVATGLVEYAEHLRGHPLRDTLPHELAAAFARHGAHWPLADRLLALEALGRLGDPRLAEDLWVEIPGGAFTFGGDPEARSGSLGTPDAHEVTLSPYAIAWRPVTVADFVPFVEEGWRDERWWTAGRGPEDEIERADWPAQRLHPNRPVIGVSWYAAKAFCAWASAKWPLPDGWRVDLPTEAQWERAARGTDGRVYPWGDETPGEGNAARANYNSSGPRHPTPVGAFPTGNRGRLVDLAGNVWEWCLDHWRTVTDDTWQPCTDPCHLRENPNGLRVLRGGSWDSSPSTLRSMCRSPSRSREQYSNVGFRVVRVRVREHVPLAD